MNKIAENIYNFRCMFGYTQEYMASILGISHTAYAQMERGEKKISEDRLAIICKILDIEPYTLKTFDKNSFKKSHKIHD